MVIPLGSGMPIGIGIDYCGALFYYGLLPCLGFCSLCFCSFWRLGGAVYAVFFFSSLVVCLVFTSFQSSFSLASSFSSFVSSTFFCSAYSLTSWAASVSFFTLWLWLTSAKSPKALLLFCSPGGFVCFYDYYYWVWVYWSCCAGSTLTICFLNFFYCSNGFWLSLRSILPHYGSLGDGSLGTLIRDGVSLANASKLPNSTGFPWPCYPRFFFPIFSDRIVLLAC